jgi:hypothetical protein
MSKTVKPKRYIFKSDDVGHWYLIEADSISLFEQWEEADYDHFDIDFSDCRIDGSPSNYTFTDPEAES